MATSSLLSCMLAHTVVLPLSIHRWLGVLPVAMRLASTGFSPSQRYRSMWFRRLAAVTNQRMSGEKRR